jgi:hypothetical protein
MTDQTPPGPSWQQPPPPPGPSRQPPPPPPPGYPPQGFAPQGYQQPQQGYGQQYPGYPPQRRKPLNLARLVFVGAWVVLGLYGLWFVYSLTQDDEFGSDFGDRLFSGLLELATGVFYAGVLLAVSVWLDRQKAND